MNPAERALRNSGYIRILEEQGLTVIPMSLMKILRTTDREVVIEIEGRQMVLSPASPGDVERIGNGKMMD